LSINRTAFARRSLPRIVDIPERIESFNLVFKIHAGYNTVFFILLAPNLSLLAAPRRAFAVSKKKLFIFQIVASSIPYTTYELLSMVCFMHLTIDLGRRGCNAKPVLRLL
jgi:hypothetical protein